MLVQQISQAKGIRELLHFTRVENLSSIISRGLLTRNNITLQRTTGLFNDTLRLDGTDAICASIGFPNYKMFYKLRTENPSSEWVVISIRPAALWELRCAFCHTNAASSMITSTPLINRTTYAAFEAMYADFGRIKRETLGIPESWPTNPQAEVLFLDGIPRQYIMGVYTENRNIQSRLSAMGLGVEFRTDSSKFSARPDYKHWKGI